MVFRGEPRGCAGHRYGCFEYLRAPLEGEKVLGDKTARHRIGLGFDSVPGKQSGAACGLA
jgi:hypothetical protein